MGIVTEYPAWFVLLCFMAGLVYASLLYLREKREEFSPLLKIILATFRFAAVSILAFLLLSPMLKSEVFLTENPVIIFAHDNSESILNTKDSLFYRTEYRDELNRLRQSLKSRFELREFTFGSVVTASGNIGFSEKVTDISMLFDELSARYSNVNVGAVIIASDGNINRGSNPLYGNRGIQAPVYTIALGDTNIYRDLILYKINYNRLAYLNNEFPLQIIVNARKAAGMNSRLSVQWEGKTLYSQVLDIKAEDAFIEIPVTLKAEQAGVQRYRVSLSGIQEEVSLQNNTEDVYVEVLDGRQKILILANSPHPDISALKQAISGNMNYEVDDFLIGDFDAQVEAYNLVILHQLPSKKYHIGQILGRAETGSVPLLFILGPQSDLQVFNNSKTGLSILSQKNTFQEVLPSFSGQFTLFNVDAEGFEAMSDFPPLVVPFGDFRLAPAVTVLAYQKIGSLVTGNPLIMFNPTPGQKTGVVTGSGMWRWRMKTFAQEGSHQVFDQLINRIVQYLSVKMDKSLFRVISAKNAWYDSESVEFEAELYTDSYELTDQPDVSMEVESAEGKRYDFTFSRSGGKYYLNAGSLSPGTYKYNARTGYNNKNFTAEGRFTVQRLSIETRKTVADHNLLFSFSGATGGRMYYPATMTQLADDIASGDNMKPVIYEQKRFNDLINFLWIMALILALLFLEWFLRKRAGSY
ncbi:MAG: hypothetical protein JXA03_00960 [Bacteroidales bacterium]|nr:hypothetical protein [Bacteroidales bacterium]